MFSSLNGHKNSEDFADTITKIIEMRTTLNKNKENSNPVLVPTQSILNSQQAMQIQRLTHQNKFKLQSIPNDTALFSNFHLENKESNDYDESALEKQAFTYPQQQNQKINRTRARSIQGHNQYQSQVNRDKSVDYATSQINTTNNTQNLDNYYAPPSLLIEKSTQSIQQQPQIQCHPLQTCNNESTYAGFYRVSEADTEQEKTPRPQKSKGQYLIKNRPLSKFRGVSFKNQSQVEIRLLNSNRKQKNQSEKVNTQQSEKNNQTNNTTDIQISAFNVKREKDKIPPLKTSQQQENIFTKKIKKPFLTGKSQQIEVLKMKSKLKNIICTII